MIATSLLPFWYYLDPFGRPSIPSLFFDFQPARPLILVTVGLSQRDDDTPLLPMPFVILLSQLDLFDPIFEHPTAIAEQYDATQHIDLLLLRHNRTVSEPMLEFLNLVAVWILNFVEIRYAYHATITHLYR